MLFSDVLSFYHKYWVLTFKNYEYLNIKTEKISSNTTEIN